VAEVRIAGSTDDGVWITIVEREHRNPRSEGWLDAEVRVSLGAWSGRYAARFHEDDFPPFARQLEELHATLVGEARLSSLDGYLDITLTGDGVGHITIAGEAWDRPRWASHLVIAYEMDQTELPQLRASLASLAAYLSRTG
jgi:hypothetical protein